MKESSEIVIESKKKPARRKYTIAAVCFLLLAICTFAITIIRWEEKSDPASEKIIRETAAKQLNKDPNDLTDEDFEQITEITFSLFEFSDIKLLEKFSNLQKLLLSDIRYLEKKYS